MEVDPEALGTARRISVDEALSTVKADEGAESVMWWEIGSDTSRLLRFDSR